MNQVTTGFDQDFQVKEETTYKGNSDDVDHIQLSVDEQVLHDYQSDVDVQKTTRH
ncbi:hypothetical protein [Rummeliibacillus sp. TYF005]|uniref:hypothetical protein n=1 Tax=Rummeliibacillus sp. TYF005 TaxID=2058214 RepID=UPI0013DDE15E|nr:hypothetical protein [Rummeliibacillus sp. TYF005]